VAGFFYTGGMANSKPAATPAELLEALRQRFRPFPLIQNWGVEIVDLAPGRARMSLSANEHTTNPGGERVNGGVLATLADMACALSLSTAFGGAMPFFTSDLHIRYLEAADGDVVAEAEVIRRSSRSAVIECRLRVKDQVVALCTSHFTIKPRLLV